MVLEGLKKNDTVYLVGTSETIKQTPWDKPDIDYWGAFSVTTQKESEKHKLNAVFETHDITIWGLFEERILKFQEEYPDVPIVMHEKNDRIKNSVEYPLFEIQEKIDNIYLRKYFTSSIAYMIAYAIHLGYKKIVMYGISLGTDEEQYSFQRACVEAWLNYGLGKGVKYELAQPSAVMHSNFLYGYEQHKDIIVKVSQLKESMAGARDVVKKKLDEVNSDYWVQEGAVRAMDLLLKQIGSQHE